MFFLKVKNYFEKIYYANKICQEAPPCYSSCFILNRALYINIIYIYIKVILMRLLPR